MRYFYGRLCDKKGLLCGKLCKNYTIFSSTILTLFYQDSEKENHVCAAPTWRKALLFKILDKIIRIPSSVWSVFFSVTSFSSRHCQTGLEPHVFWEYGVHYARVSPGARPKSSKTLGTRLVRLSLPFPPSPPTSSINLLASQMTPSLKAETDIEFQTDYCFRLVLYWPHDHNEAVKQIERVFDVSIGSQAQQLQ